MTSPALSEYTAAFEDATSPFLTYYSIGADKSLNTESFTRGEFWCVLARRRNVRLPARPND